MSDTPKTDANCGWPVDYKGRIECSDFRWSPDGSFVHSEVARELERENAALRVALEDIMTESDEQVIWRMARAALERKEPQP
jgi:hypothetical protein